MDYLSLKIDNQWAVLDEGTEIALEGNNPLFSDAGSKSYLFRLHVESNRHIFGTSDEIYGESYYKVIDGKRSTLYVMGIPVMTGKISLEDEVMMEDGYVAVNLVSGNLEFAQMIEGMNCREVELLDEEIVVGRTYDKVEFTVDPNKDLLYDPDNVFNVSIQHSFDLPREFVTITDSNIVHPYPEKAYCNIRACYTIGDKSLLNSAIQNNPKLKENDMVEVNKELAVLGVNRHNSSLCFYILYFLDCLFKKLKVSASSERNALLSIEDAKRLAFVNMNCFVNTKGEEWVSTGDIVEDVPGFEVIWDSSTWRQWFYQDFAPVWLAGTRRFRRQTAVATSENFPNEDVKKVIESLEAIFGAKFVYDSESNRMSIFLLRDILRSSDVVDLSAEVYENVKLENKIKGFRLSYGESDDKNLHYNYEDYENVKSISQYSEALRGITSFDRTRYIDARNGNAYAVMVESEANENGDVEKLYPSLIEVDEFADAIFGDCSEEDYTEIVTLPFSPIINNDVEGPNNVSISKSDKESTDSSLSNTYALFIDEDIEPKWVEFSEKHVDRLTNLKNGYTYEPKDTNYTVGIRYLDYLGSNSGIVARKTVWGSTSNKGIFPADAQPIVNSYDTGFMLGIMRGPGNEAGVEYFDNDFDGEGNSRVAFTSANYAFTSDSVDNCNRVFDYNGENADESGIDQSGRFSLKLRAGKYDKDGNPIKHADGNEIIIPTGRSNRGLYDKFWKEYAYFTVNKKILRITCRMEIADLVAIDWTKRYRIGEHVGFIANYSYSVSTDGMSDVEMDLYYI